MFDKLRLSLLQSNILWEDKAGNLAKLGCLLPSLAGCTDIAVLPEMFSTGFTMRPELFAEPTNGQTITQLRQWSKEYNIALAGSFIARDENFYYNKAFFLTPEGGEYYYNKHHLFRLSEEPNHYQAGKERLIVNYRGWNIFIAICYDLRFPVWCRNVGCEYDLMLVPASWPSSRERAWSILLPARAIENLCYIAGVNRVGHDGFGVKYTGASALYNAKGESQALFCESEEGIRTVELSLADLQNFRCKFSAWKDADGFVLT